MHRTLVWLKRDLRQRDHAPLYAAQAAGAFEAASATTGASATAPAPATAPASASSSAALYVIEPEWLASPEFSPSHLHFTLQCLAELRRDLSALGLPLLVRVGAVPAVFEELRREFDFTQLFSHEETGPGWTYARDIAVAGWCQARGVAWQEWPQTGVVRRLRTRQGWAGRWAQRMNAAALPAPVGFRGAPLAMTDLPTLASLGVAPVTQALQAAGESAAWAELHGFLQGRASGYRRALSSPLTAESGCSRLSPHLAFGSISMRDVHQATQAAITTTPDRALAYALRGFAGRLRWHCHFMQKLEDEPAIEDHNFARAFDGLREDDFNAARFEAWCAGRTGYPMVDACMRSLVATGWLNFRMRAMLVSFAAYHLWLHWRQPGLFLARQFLDFEPGIHWSQMQMQSGTTGINTLRIYSPAKQAREHDPHGEFVRRWVPEFGTPHYPAPIVDERQALAFAKDRMYGQRATPEARAEASAVQHKHGSRKSGLPPSGMKRKTSTKAIAPSPQGELF